MSRAGSHRAAEVQASTDALTGLPNRRYFDEFCGLLAQRRRAEDGIGVLMVDIDRFKLLNDRFGHAAGDDVLKAVGRAIVGAVRDDDVPARYGGEEFVVLLRNPTERVALEIGERVRESVAALDLSDLGIPAVSVSVGVAVADRLDQPIDELVETPTRRSIAPSAAVATGWSPRKSALGGPRARSRYHRAVTHDHLEDGPDGDDDPPATHRP